ncbi:MAG TPA: hypothetical protein VJU02_01285 [Nitrospiraceae bacterium]|nr:hypothetical protein [Nitrospiraceae bacterium]
MTSLPNTKAEVAFLFPLNHQKLPYYYQGVEEGLKIGHRHLLRSPFLAKIPREEMIN